MKKNLKTIVIALAMVILGTGIFIPILAAATPEDQPAPPQQAQEMAGDQDVVISVEVQEQTKETKAWAAAIVVGIAAASGAIGMAIAIRKSVEGVARQPEASGKIQTMLMLGLVFIETAIIYALIVAILIIFVL